MLPLPCRAVEVMDLTPSTCITASSMGSTTSFSMTSGEAPSHVTEMLMVGKSTSGNWLMPMRCGRHQSEDDGRRHEHPGEDRLLDAGLGDAHRPAPPWFPPSVRRRRLAREPGLRALGRAHRRTVLQRLRAAHHQLLTRLQALAHLHQAVRRAQPQLQHALARLAVLDHVGQEAALAGAHRRLRHHGRALGRVHAARSPRRRPRAAGPRRPP